MLSPRKVQKWRRLFGRLLFAVLVVTVAFWASSHGTRQIIVVEREGSHESIQVVPRGQTFFHSYPESNRYTSDDTWRPHEFYQPDQMFQNRQHKNSHFRQDIPLDKIDGAERVLLLVKSSMQTLWKQLPTHLFTTLTQFPNAILYSDGPDSIGGIEVVDIISYIDKKQLQTSEELLYYRIHRSLRDKHVYIAPDEVHVAGGEHIDKFKHLHLLLHAWEQQSAHRKLHLGDFTVPKQENDEDGLDWYVMVDDDSFIIGPSMIEFLNKLDPSKPYYLGSATWGDERAFADGSSGIILSREAMRQAFDHKKVYDWIEEYTRQAEQETRGDYVLARYLGEMCDIQFDEGTSNDHFQGHPVWKVDFNERNWCKQVFSFARQTSRDIELLWEYQRVKSSNLLYVDFYLDFVKPFFPAGPQKNWDNGASTQEFYPGEWYDENAPYASYDRCRRTCEDNGNCLMFRHDAYTHYCGLGLRAVSLGRPTIQYSTGPDASVCERLGRRCKERAKGEEMISGWFLDRVSAMRGTLACDPLHENRLIEGERGTSLDQAEGWWLRAKERYGSGAKDPLV